MRIHDPQTRLDRTAARPPGVKDGAPPSPAERGASSTRALEVNVSQRAQELGRASAAASSRVADLRAKIERGAFVVDASKVAARMLGDDP
jgi:flagellar biosynthesis anti-sigma factor FlgM